MYVTEPQMVVLSSMSLGGNNIPVENLAESLQVALDGGFKRLLLPMASVGDIATIPGSFLPSFRPAFMLIQKMRCLRHWGCSKPCVMLRIVTGDLKVY